jgi:hypothetical protein
MNEAATSLAAAETAFAAHSVREGMRKAFLAAFTDDGVFVRTGWTNSNAYLEKQPDPPIVLDWRPAYVEVSASGDLGYARGSYSDPATSKLLGYYLRVWRLEGSAWRVILDVTNPVPRPATS